MQIVTLMATATIQKVSIHSNVIINVIIFIKISSSLQAGPIRWLD